MPILGILTPVQGRRVRNDCTRKEQGGTSYGGYFLFVCVCVFVCLCVCVFSSVTDYMLLLQDLCVALPIQAWDDMCIHTGMSEILV